MQVLQDVGEAAAGTEAENWRRRKGDHGSTLDLPELAAKSRNQRGRAKRPILALLERLERNHHEGCVRLRVVVDEIQTDDRRKVRDGFLLAQDVLGLADCSRRP